MASNVSGNAILRAASDGEISPDEAGDLHLLGDAGHSLLQLVSIILQYDNLIDDVALNVERQANVFDLISLAEALSPHLKIIGERLDEAEQKVAIIHDKAVPPA